MVSAELERLVDQRLADPSFLQAHGRVSSNVMRAIRESLLDLPEEALETFLNSQEQIVVGNKQYFEKLFAQHGKKFSALGQHIRTENAQAFGGRPTVIVRSDISTEQIKHVNRHEIGHAIDHINAGYRGYASVNSTRFRSSAEAYLEYKQTSGEHSEIAYRGSRSFAHGHAPHYGLSNGRINNALYKELTAEMFDKYSVLAKERGVQAADEFMSRNYLEAWTDFKLEVVPQIGREVQRVNVPRQVQQSTPSRDPAHAINSALGNPRNAGIAYDERSGTVRFELDSDYSRDNLSAIGIKKSDLQYNPTLSERSGKRVYEMRVQDLPSHFRSQALDTPARSSTPSLPSSQDAQQFLRHVPNHLIESTNKGLYIKIDNVDAANIDKVERALGAMGISYEDRVSGSRGRVLNIKDPAHIELFRNIQAGHNVEPLRSRDRSGSSALHGGDPRRSKAGLVGRLAAGLPFVGIALGAAGARASVVEGEDMATLTQQQFASGDITEAQRDALIGYHKEVTNMQLADAAVGEIDQTGFVSVFLTLGVEAQTRAALDKAALETDLPENIYQQHVRSAFGGHTHKYELLITAADGLPRAIDEAPAIFHDAIRLKAAFEEARIEESNMRLALDDLNHPRVANARYQLEMAEKALISEMEELFNDPDTIHAFLDTIPLGDRLAFAKALAETEPDMASFERNFPNLYKATQNETAAAPDASADARAQAAANARAVVALRDNNGEALNNYIVSRVSPEKMAPAAATQTAQTKNDTVDFAAYNGDPGMYESAAKAGIDVPDIAVAQTQAPSPDFAVSAPQV